MVTLGKAESGKLKAEMGQGAVTSLHGYIGQSGKWKAES
jgi:hypothetical protein